MNRLFQHTAVSPSDEMISYETLWGMPGASLKKLADEFRSQQIRPSELLRKKMQEDFVLGDLVDAVRQFVQSLTGFSISVHGCYQYPERLRDARHPIEVFYYRGDIGLTESKCISVVGARKASDYGIRRAKRLSHLLVENGWTIVSGLAAGIDTAAMQAAIDAKGHTIGVIGTPINESYPRQNKALQEKVACEHLLISQVPFFRYSRQPYQTKRLYFPERNATMASLSEATVIVEASDTSGSLTQARSCLQQGRKLFILNSCFERSDITWPRRFEEQGAIRIRTFDELLDEIKE